METKNTGISTKQIAAQLAAFSAPLILSGILQQLYNWVDAFVVGNVNGETSLAAVGGTTSIINFYLLAITGFTLGLAILFAQRYGSGDTEDYPKILSTFSILLEQSSSPRQSSHFLRPCTASPDEHSGRYIFPGIELSADYLPRHPVSCRI